MQLREQASVADGDLPMAELGAHLRLGTGFASDGMQDALLRGYLRAALAAIEGRIGKALLARRFVLGLAGWRDGRSQALPLAPVGAVVAVRVIGADGVAVEVPAGRWRLMADAQRPRLVARGPALPVVPEGGQAEVEFDAGFGDWAAVPPDLRQAVLLLAAHYHEYRHEAGMETGAGALPFGIMALIERWRTVRVLGGGGA